MSSSPSSSPARDFDDAWIVVPAFNEGIAIATVVGELRDVFAHVVVVDDGSTDNTLDTARSTGAVGLRHLVNLGQGASLQTGIDYALGRGARRLGTFDADGQHRVEDLVRLFEALGDDCEIALGSRFLGPTGGIPLVRKALLRGAVLFTRAMTGLAITDAHNGLRTFTHRAAIEIDLRNNRMAHASELLDQIARCRLPFRELAVEVRYTDYSVEKGQRSTDAFRVLFDYLVSRVFD